jgi:hypothetical protein
MHGLLDLSAIAPIIQRAEAKYSASPYMILQPGIYDLSENQCRAWAYH